MTTEITLRSALQRLYDETADYIHINNLGDVHHNQAMKDARDALAIPAAQPAPGWISDLQLAAELLEQMYEKWENGDPCFSDSDDFMGNAFLLGDLEDKIVDVLNRLFPRKAAPPGPAQEPK